MLTSSMLHLISPAPFCFGFAVVWFTAGKTVVAKDEVVEEMDVMDQLKEVLEFPRLQNSCASFSAVGSSEEQLEDMQEIKPGANSALREYHSITDRQEICATYFEQKQSTSTRDEQFSWAITKSRQLGTETRKTVRQAKRQAREWTYRMAGIHSKWGRW